MKKGFHDKRFDESTRVKLEVFRRYVREWLPVFMTETGQDWRWEGINLYDFFAGPGCDGDDNPGSPLIIQEEVKSFCDERAEVKSNIPVRMVFNDIDATHIDLLKDSVEAARCTKDCCSFEYHSEKFSAVVEKYLPQMKERGQANLVIMDQFGVKEVTPSIVRKILDAGTTDILFFISTAHIRRFADTPEFKNWFKIDSSEIKTIAYNLVHRYLCDYFQKELNCPEAMLAPFSIKKGSNIYGVIFASKNELGMEKFLKVCWSLDQVTGEANYNIDNEMTWDGEQTLFAEYNKPTKETVFETELLNFIKTHEPNNKEVLRFALERGFYSAKCGEALKALQNAKKITVFDLPDLKPARRGAFYLTEKSERSKFKGA